MSATFPSAVGVALLLVPVVAGAQQSVWPEAFVIPLCDDDPFIASVRRQLNDALVDDGWDAKRPQPADAVWSRPCGRWQGMAVEARDRLKRGRKLVARGKLKGARDALAMPVEMVEAAVMAGAGDAVVEIWIELARIELGLGDSKRAVEDLREAFFLMPELKLAKSYPKALRELAADTAAAVTEEPLVELVVVLRPSDADVQLNGVRQPQPGGRFTGVRPGLNFLTVGHPELGLLARPIMLSAEPRQVMQLDFSRERRAAWTRMLTAGEVDPVLDELVALPAQAVVLLEPGEQPGDPLRALVATGGADTPGTLVSLTLDSNPKLAVRYLLAHVGPAPEPTIIAAPDPLASTVNGSDSGSGIDTGFLREYWWLWAGIGAVVVVGVTTGLSVHAAQNSDRVQIGVRW